MIIDLLKEEVKKNKKKIVINELDDERMISAIRKVLDEDLVSLILIGTKELDYDISSRVTYINPEDSELFDDYANRLYELRKDKGLTIEEARNLLLNDYMYFSCMLVLDNKADGVVSGLTHTTKDTLSPALKLIKGKELISSFFLMETNYHNENDGIFIFADCGLNQNPTSKELSIIAKESIDSFNLLVKKTPYVAFLSHSTYGSSNHEMVNKVKDAVMFAKEDNPTYYIDGEMQLDAAIVPEVAKVKCPESKVAGKANILIFPDIDSGNIGYKLVERFGNAKAYGPLIQGLNYPVNDLSRGSSVDDIVGVIIITALQATKNMI